MAVSDNLTALLENIDPRRRYYTGTDKAFKHIFIAHSCVFGLPASHQFAVINEIPDTTKSLHFYFGSNVNNLLEAVLDTGIAKEIEHLTVGYASINPIDLKKYDYSEAITILEKHNFPKLKSFELGVDFLLANEHCFYGRLGNITKLLTNMPHLETLEMYGNFELTKPLYFKYLNRLEITMDDWATHVNGGKISEETILNLLNSAFDKLKLLYLDLSFNDDNYGYSIPDGFFNEKANSKLKHLELAGKFVSGTRNAIRGRFGNLEKLFIDSIDEPEAY